MLLDEVLEPRKFKRADKERKTEMIKESEKAFSFIQIPPRSRKPRESGITSVTDRGMGPKEVESICEAAGEYIDIFKTGLGVQRLQGREFTKQKNAILNRNNIEVFSGGILMEVALKQGVEAVRRYLEEAKDLGYTVIEISTGYVVLPFEHKLALVKEIQKFGLKAIMEVGFKNLDWERIAPNVDLHISEIRRSLDAGAWKVVVESEGIVEQVSEFREEIIYKIMAHCKASDLIFEGPEKRAYAWFVGRFGPEINLAVEAGQILDLELFRRGMRETKERYPAPVTFLPNN